MYLNEFFSLYVFLVDEIKSKLFYVRVFMFCDLFVLLNL